MPARYSLSRMVVWRCCLLVGLEIHQLEMHHHMSRSSDRDALPDRAMLACHPLRAHGDAIRPHGGRSDAWLTSARRACRPTQEWPKILGVAAIRAAQRPGVTGSALAPVPAA